MAYVWLALLGGAAAFPHCLGMCGGFALHFSSGEERAKALGRQVCWHAGRITTYVFLGAFAGYFGAVVVSLARWPWIRTAAGYAVAALMIAMGLVLLGLSPARIRRPGGDAQEGLFASIFRQFLGRPTAGAGLALGLATGFLPCPVTIGFLGLAAESGSVLMGMLIMAAMGIGTMWALLLLGLTGNLLTAKIRRWGTVVVGVVLILLGTWTMLRKANILPPLPGGIHMAAPKDPCCFNLDAPLLAHAESAEPSANALTSTRR